MRVATNWACSGCGERIPVHLSTTARADDEGRASVSVTVPEVALADVFAHAWTHFEEWA